MDQQTNTPNTNDQVKKEPVKISTTVTCPHCGKDHEVQVEVPEEEKTPKMAWQG